MAFVIPIAIAIGEAVASAAVTVAAVVASAAVAVASAAAAVASWIWSGITAVYAFVAEAVSEIAYGYAQSVYILEGTAGFTGESLFAYVGAYANVLVTSFGSFLEIIHFKTLLTIHEIAYLVSEDYREMIKSVYSTMSEVSYALGYGADFMNLLIRDSRSVVLDASAMMGQPYDLAEINWLKSLQGYLRVFSDRASVYTRNPVAIFFDIDGVLTKPAIDNKAGIMQVFYQTIDSTLRFVRTGIEQTDKLRIDMGKLISDFPHQIRDEVKPWFDKVTKDFADWVQTDYRPSLKVIDGVLNALGVQQEIQRKGTRDLVNRLKRPASYLKEIDNFPDEDRKRQEKEISEIAFRASSEESEEWIRVTDLEATKLIAEGRILRAPSERPSWEVFEVEIPERPAGAPVEPRETWFVGDF